MSLFVPNVVYGQRLKRFLQTPRAGQLRDTQKEALSAIAGEIVQGEQRLYVDKPAGSGKTRLSFNMIDAIGTDIPQRTLIVLPTHKILRQTHNELAAYNPAWLANGWVGNYHAYDKTPKAPIILTTYQSLLLGTERGHFKPDKTALIVLDEAQHALSEARQELSARYEDTLQIGLTASPAYSAEKMLDNRFKLAYRLSPADAVKRGVTSPYRNFMLLTEGFSLDSVKIETTGDFNQKQLAAITDDALRYEQIAQFIELWRDPELSRPLYGQPSLAFCATIQQSENAAAFFNRYFRSRCGKGVQFAAAVHSALTRDEQDRIDDRFRSGRILMLTTPQLLLEGYDNPGVRSIFNIVPTISAVRALQRGGRAMRVDPVRPDDESVVIDVVDQGINKRALLYGEAVGGVRFYRQADIPPVTINSNEMSRALGAYWKEREGGLDAWRDNGPRVVAPDELIERYAARAVARKPRNKNLEGDALLKKIPALAETFAQKTSREKGWVGQTMYGDPMLKSLRDGMDKMGYFSIRQICEKWNEFSASNNADYHKMLLLALGIRPIYSDKKDKELTPEAEIFVRVLDLPAVELFSAHHQVHGPYHDRDPGYKFSEPRQGYDPDKDYLVDASPMCSILPNIRLILSRNGYEDVKAFIRAINMEAGYNAVRFQDITYLAKGLQPVTWNPRNDDRNLSYEAQVFADFLQTEPEDLFSEDQYFTHVKRMAKLALMRPKSISKITRSLTHQIGRPDYDFIVTQTSGGHGQSFKPPRQDAICETERQSLTITFGRAKDFRPIYGPQHPPRWATWVPT